MSDKPKLKRPELLRRSHDRSQFDCEVAVLNEYLKKYALQNQKKDVSRTYVAVRENTVVGYYTLAFGSVSRSEAPDHVAKGLPRHPIPIMLLARLAVDRREKNIGMGKGLLKDAILRCLQACHIAGLRALVVHAKDKNARRFYEKFGFSQSPIDPFHLFLTMDTIRKTIAD